MSLPAAVTHPTEPAIEWSIESQPEGFLGIEAAGGAVVAVGETGTYQLDGSVWNRIADGAGTYDFSLAPDGALFALKGSSLVRRDGASWTTVRTFTFTSEYPSIPAVWAYSAGDVFVVTTEEFEIPGYLYWTESALHHFDGTSWTVVGRTNVRIADMWGSSPSDIYLAASDGLYHYDGSAVTKIEAAGNTALRTIGGTSESDIYGLHPDGSVLVFDGTTFSTLPAPPAQGMKAVRRIGGDLFVCGYYGACYRYAGGAWTSVSLGSSDQLSGVWGTSAADIVAVGDGGIVQLENGGWRRVRGGTPAYLSDIWVADTGEVFVVGDEGAIEMRDDNGWRPMIGLDDARQTLNGVSGTAHDNVYAVGAGGRILHFDGTAWFPMSSGTAMILNSVWVGENTAVAVGSTIILKLDNGVWSKMTAPIPSTYRLQDVWGASNGELFVVGYVNGADHEGFILHFDGSSWAPANAETRRLWGVLGFAPDDVFAIGESGPQDGATRYWAASIYHFDGVAWTRMWVSEDIAYLTSVWGSSSDYLVAVGGNGLLRYDGKSWSSEMPVGLDASGLNDVSAGDGTDIFAVGGHAVVRFHFTR